MAKAEPTTVDESLFDGRTVDRHIAEGRTTREAYEAYLASLPDDTEEATESDVRLVICGRALDTHLANQGAEEEEN
ncbi:MAG: hypothetical protein FJ090_06865 [Deltaproteobacteria bacterium]|nr:hypothetical protein [Deltaproteobacteria bacterium]